MHALVRLAFYENFLVNGQELMCLLSALTSVYITFKRPNQGFRRVTYVPSMNFKTSSSFTY